MDDNCLLSCFESLSNSCGNTVQVFLSGENTTGNATRIGSNHDQLTKILQVLRLDNCGFRLSRPVETLTNLKPLLKSMTALATVSVNNMTCVASDLEEGGAARVRDLLEKHTPLLCSMIKHLPNLERLSMMRYEVCPEQLPRLVRAIKSQVSRRNGVLTLQAKHAGRCRVHPDPTAGDPALTSLISRLERSKRVSCSYSGATGVLRVEAVKSQGILRRVRK